MGDCHPNDLPLFNIPALIWAARWKNLQGGRGEARDANEFWHAVAISSAYDDPRHEDRMFLAELAAFIYYKIEDL